MHQHLSFCFNLANGKASLFTGEAVRSPCAARPGAFFLRAFVVSAVDAPEFQRALPRVDPEGDSAQAGLPRVDCSGSADSGGCCCWVPR